MPEIVVEVDVVDEAVELVVLEVVDVTDVVLVGGWPMTMLLVLHGVTLTVALPYGYELEYIE